MKYDDEVIVDIVCPFCGNTHSVRVSERQYYAWEGGELIQKAMSSLSATEREQLISHICPRCQANIFGEDEEEEEDVDACMRESLEFTGQWW